MQWLTLVVFLNVNLVINLARNQYSCTIQISTKRYAVPVLRQKSIEAIPRCAHHFTEDNLETRSSDHTESHKQACLSQSLERICLKPTAVPHIFPLLPQYLSSNSSAPQPTTSSTSSAVLINENSQINKHVSYYLKEKIFSGVQRNVKI